MVNNNNNNNNNYNNNNPLIDVIMTCTKVNKVCHNNDNDNDNDNNNNDNKAQVLESELFAHQQTIQDIPLLFWQSIGNISLSLCAILSFLILTILLNQVT